VISIIGMLMALLLPAVQAAREAGRKASCANNLYNLSRAVMNYETTKHAFPGYANKINVDKTPAPNGKYRVGTYMVVLLPYLERRDLYDAWADPFDYSSDPDALAKIIVKLDAANCPSDADTADGGGSLSYTVNAGGEYVTLPSSPAYDVKHIAAGGLFHNLTIGDSPRVSMDYVSSKDGTSTTLMFAENLQAGTWNLDPQLLDKELPADLNKPYAARDKLAARAKAMTTFVWWGDVDNNGNPPDLSRSPDLPEKDSARINGGNIYYTVTDSEYNSTTNTDALRFARPSAQHSGGVTVAFCDGHTRFMTDDMDYRLYIQLMTPNGRGIHPKTATIIKPFIVDESKL
jgi:prepilin-type processing-associated H-X9-DG protein